MIVYQRLSQGTDDRRDYEVIMRNLLTVAFILSMLYACGGEFQYQDKASADKAPPTEQSTMAQTAVEEQEANNKQAAETTDQTVTEAKTDSAIKMFRGVARSMF